MLASDVFFLTSSQNESFLVIEALTLREDTAGRRCHRSEVIACQTPYSWSVHHIEIEIGDGSGLMMSLVIQPLP